MKVSGQLLVPGAIVVFVALALLWLNSTSTRRNAARGDGAVQLASARKDFGAGWRLLSVEPSQATEFAAAIAERVRLTLASQADPPGAVEKLAVDTRTATHAILSRDWTPWRDAMLARGMRPAHHMKATVDLIGERVSRDTAGPARWDALSVEEKYAWMWANPQDRLAEIQAVAVENVSASFGSSTTPLLPGLKGQTVKAFFVSPNDAKLNDRIAADNAPTWGVVIVPVQLRSGERIELYLRFVWDELAGEWVPESSTSVGFDNPARIWF